MSLGLGLESLIPKKQSQVQKSVPEPQSSERIFEPRVDFSSPQTGDNLIREPQKHSYVHESVFHIEVEKIKPNPFQPRKDFDGAGLEELAQSIREFGIIQPLIVSKVIKETETGTEVEYQLIAGERRLLAAKMIGLERVPAIVKKVDLGRAKLEMALIENLQRSDLNPLEAARAYARLQDEFGLTQREIAARVGKSREAIANTLRLLNLSSEIQEALVQNKINESQARTLLGIANPQEQRKAFQNLISQKMSVRALREKIDKPKTVDPEGQYWEKQLEEKLGAPVKILRRGSHGKMVVNFYSEEEWQGIIRKILGSGDELG